MLSVPWRFRHEPLLNRCPAVLRMFLASFGVFRQSFGDEIGGYATGRGDIHQRRLLCRRCSRGWWIIVVSATTKMGKPWTQLFVIYDTQCISFFLAGMISAVFLLFSILSPHDMTMNECCSDDSYDQAVAWCLDTISSSTTNGYDDDGNMMLFCQEIFHREIASASSRFDMPHEAVHSLFRNAHVSYMKRQSHIVRSQTMRHVKSYLNGTSILNLARRCNYPPSMMARLIVENVASSSFSSSFSSSLHLANTTTTTTTAVASLNNKHAYNNLNQVTMTKINDASSSSMNDTNSGGSNKSSKKFLTNALRYPEKTLGDASVSVLPEYLFSERNGTVAIVSRHANHPDGAIPLSRLSREVRHAVDSDPMYGPRHDKVRHNIGIEYELLLEETLQSMDIPFETEADLRVRGTARTPDVLLSIPLGIRVRKGRNNRDNGANNTLRMAMENPSHTSNNNKGEGAILEDEIIMPRKMLFDEEKHVETTVQKKHQRLINDDDCQQHDDTNNDDEYEWKTICWIDSKALFGDIETHTNSVLPQVETYVHRFGPGLVLYWFGHAPLSRLDDGHGDVMIMGGDLPNVFLLPTGELHVRGGGK